jgi:hypothetical protein
MNELVAWPKEQNEGVCTYISPQQRAYGLARSNPEQTAVSGCSAPWLPATPPSMRTCRCPQV